tara:strand:- start:133 stop:912 length:780 start_codon:yes stop_codon:yes gene_type:complete
MAEFNPFKQIGTFLGGGVADRSVDLNPGYIQPFIPTPGYDKNNPYGLGDDEIIRNIDGTQRVISKDAPQGLRRVWAGMRDRLSDERGLSSWWYSGKTPDHDMRGTPDRWGIYPTEGIGRVPEKVEPFTANSKYPGNPNLAGAGPVPKLPQGLNWGQMAITEWNRYRSRGDVNWGLQRTADALKDATYYGLQADKYGLYTTHNTPFVQTKTNYQAQQAKELARYAKAGLIEARAKSAEAASAPQKAAADLYGALKTRDIV